MSVCTCYWLYDLFSTFFFAAVFPKKENEIPGRSSFQEMMHARKTQAHRSVLIAVADKADIPFAVACCEKYGSIANIYLHPGESENVRNAHSSHLK